MNLMSFDEALPVVFMSGYLGENDGEAVRRARGRVHKPFTTAQLVEAIERALSAPQRAEG